MNKRISKIENDVQDRNSVAWKELCEYVDMLASAGGNELLPLEVLGPDLFSQIYTLPETISKLKSVTKISLYGSSLKRIPPEIGEMEALEYFDPYTSYSLHWFPYEIVHCKNLKDSRVSTRALYGNFKTRIDFPKLANNPVRYFGDRVKCSVCKKEMKYAETNQLWISLRVATDVLPLLANLCSKECESKLPQPPVTFVQFPHKGGLDLVQPTFEDWRAAQTTIKLDSEDVKPVQQTDDQNGSGLLKLVKKIWK